MQSVLDEDETVSWLCQYFNMLVLPLGVKKQYSCILSRKLCPRPLAILIFMCHLGRHYICFDLTSLLISIYIFPFQNIKTMSVLSLYKFI